MRNKIVTIGISIFISITLILTMLFISQSTVRSVKDAEKVVKALYELAYNTYLHKTIYFGYGRKLRWTIGIMEGQELNRLKDLSINPIITLDHITDYHAINIFDPFYIFDNNLHYIFYEVCGFKNNESQNYSCDIAYSFNKNSVEDKDSWLYGGSILDEEFKLSFSNIIQHSGTFYMIPESSQDKSVKLYKASNFPKQWQYVKTLISGDVFNDPTPFLYKNKWYMFVSNSDNAKMSLYMSNAIDGVWVEHPLSPIILDNPNAARSAGRVIERNGKLIRFSQNTFPIYGKSVNAHEITILTPDAYKENLLFDEPILSGDDSGWNMDFMHHIDAHQINKNGQDYIRAFVDGGTYYPVQLHGIETLYDLRRLHE